MPSRDDRVSKLAAESAFAFVGKVVDVGAATMTDIAGPDTAIVQVERLLKAPEAFRDIGHPAVTVRAGKKGLLQAGDHLTLFANGWIFGSSIALDLVGTLDETDVDIVAPIVRRATVAASDDALRARVRSAVLGVVGQVADIAAAPARTTSISEHDPDWHTAHIAVDEVLKGKKSVDHVRVLYPNSDDVRWHDIAKYSVGQQGIFLLQHGRDQDPAGIPPKILAAVPDEPDLFTTLHPDDIQPLHELERVRALVAESAGADKP